MGYGWFVDGTQYYQHIKQFVTNEPLDIKDLYFQA